MSIYRSYFSKNDTLIEDNRTNNSQNPVTEISYGTPNADVSRFIFEIDFKGLIEKIDSGTIKPEKIVRHVLKMVNTIRFSEDRVGGKFNDFVTDRTASFDLNLYNIDEDWDEGNGYDFVYIDEQFPQIPQQAVNWFDRKTDVPWTVEGGYISGTTQVLASQHFEKGNEDIEIDVTDYINDRLFSGSTGYTATTSGVTYGLGLKFPDNLEILETLNRQAVAFHVKDTTTFFEPYIETIYDDRITDDRNYFYLDKDNELYLYSNVGGTLQDVTVNSVTIIDYNDVEVAVVTGTSIENIRKGVNRITLNIDSDAYPDAVLFTDRWNVTQNGKNKDIDQEFYLISQDKYFNFDFTNRVLSDNHYFMYSGIKQSENIKRGRFRKIFVETKAFYPNQDNNQTFDIEYRLYSSQNDKYEFDVIPWTKVDRTAQGYEFTLDTSWLIPQDYSLQIRMVEGDIFYVKEKLDFSVVSDGITGAQN